MKKALSYLLIIPIIFSIVSILNPLDVSAQSDGVSLTFRHESFTDGEISTSMVIDTNGKSINRIVADFVYPSDLLEVTSIELTDSPFKNFFSVDYKTLGLVRVRYDSNEVITGDGAFAKIHFLTKSPGKAELRFTEDVLAGESFPILGQTVDYLETVEPAVYTINEDFSVLPETGTADDVVTITGIIVLILLLMIIIFTFSTFTVWGGVYLSLGKWESKLTVGAEKVSVKQDMKKSSGSKKKSIKSKKKIEGKKQ